jgi:hypothetical protein
VPPEKLQPGGVVAGDRGVVERLGVIGVGAALDQQRGECRGPWMRRLGALAFADHAGEDGEGILPVIGEAGIGVSAAVEQHPVDGESFGIAARQPRIGEVEQRLPVERPAFAARRGRIGGQPAFDRSPVAGRDGGIEAMRPEFRRSRQQARRRRRVPLSGGAEQDLRPLRQ